MTAEAASLPVEDKLEILELYARHHLTEDALDFEGTAATYTSDGAMESPMGVLRGRDELVGFFEKYRALFVGKRHLSFHHVITATADGARGESVFLLLEVATVPQLLGSGWSKDTLRKVDGRWRFVHRTFGFDAGMGKAPPLQPAG